jgi:acyl transferase domain-containing protein
MSDSDIYERYNDAAIIGMSGRFPGARNVDELWQNLCNGVESISFFSRQELETLGIDPNLLNDPNYVRAKGVLEDADLFDASFFGYTPREAQIMDPQQRLFLECAWEALENAGYDADRYEGRIGVYGGVGWNTYLLLNLYSNRHFVESVGDLQILGHGNDKDYLTTRVSYKLNLTGPSINIQTACSTSLVATCVAYQSLLNGECDMALAGGAFAAVPLKAGYLYYEGSILSPDGHCRAFDAKAGGTVFGDGVGIVVLKRLVDALEDGDYIYAVIRGSAVNNDGSAKVSYTAPSVDKQAEVIAEAMGMAGVEPETVSYIETHGTGTSLGDPIEMTALIRAFRASTEPKRVCAIGSVKTNVGHLDAAAGVTGLIKTALALERQVLPPSLNFEQPNPQVNLADSPFYVNTELLEWKAGHQPRRAGVSSFGVGGTNAHVVLEEAPERERSGPSRPFQLLMLSAKTKTALEGATEGLVSHIQKNLQVNLADMAYTLQVGRKAFNHRRVVVCKHLDDAVSALETSDPKSVFTAKQNSGYRPVVFMFSGQGAQYVNMGLELYQVEPIFREQVDLCSEILNPHLGLDLRQVLYPSEEQTSEAPERLKQTAITQPALFVIEYALAQLWREWGVEPQAMIGHSIGEYAAACLAGVFSLEEALALVAARGRLMQGLPGGSMLAVPLSEDEVLPLLDGRLSLAVVNSPSFCVVSGSTEAVVMLQNQLDEQGIGCRRLHTSHAFHSAMMDPILGSFAKQVRQIHLKPPRIPFVSNVTGTWITAAEATEPDYWVKHLRQTVRFGEGVQKFFKEPSQILLEVGPGRTLSTLAQRHPEKPPEQVVLPSLRHPQDQRSDLAFLLITLGKLWLAGVEVDWSGFYAQERRQRLPLPTYPFERNRYWIEAGKQTYAVVSPTSSSSDEPEGTSPNHRSHQASKTEDTYDGAPRDDVEQVIADVWQEVLGIEQIGIHDDFFELGGHSLSAARVIARLRDAFGLKLSLAGFFESPTVAELAEMLKRTMDGGDDFPSGQVGEGGLGDALQRLGI